MGAHHNGVCVSGKPTGLALRKRWVDRAEALKRKGSTDCIALVKSIFTIAKSECSVQHRVAQVGPYQQSESATCKGTSLAHALRHTQPKGIGRRLQPASL